MGSFSAWHWLIAALVALVLFGGKGKISALMTDVAEGIKGFKKGLKEDADPAKAAEPAKSIEAGKSAEPQTGAQSTKVG